MTSPSPEEPATQIEADVPVEPLALQADATNLDLELHAYERPLGGAQLARYACHAYRHMCFSSWKWICTDLGLPTFQGFGKPSEGTSGSSHYSRPPHSVHP